METKYWIGCMVLILTVLATGCAAPTAQVSTVSSRDPQYDRTVKRVVVVLGNLGALKSHVVRSQLRDHLKSNEVDALILEHNPMLLTPDPLVANRDAVNALRPNAILHLRVLQWTNSLHTNVQSTFAASLTVPDGRSMWGARLIVQGIEQGESALVTALMKRLIDDRIIDKNAVEPDDAPGSNRT
jgi:hypothetical protein